MILLVYNAMSQFPNEKGVWCNSYYPCLPKTPTSHGVSEHSNPNPSSQHPQLCMSVPSWPLVSPPQRWKPEVLGKECFFPGMALNWYMRGLEGRFVNLFAVWWSNSENCVLYTDSQTHSRIKLHFPQRALVRSQLLCWLLFLPISISMFSTGIFWDHIPKKLPVLESFLKINSEGTQIKSDQFLELENRKTSYYHHNLSLAQVFLFVIKLFC